MDPQDGQLLQRFAATRDEKAFEELLGMHGPMVLNVCRRVLGHEEDARDACQAAFMVLARKAASFNPKGSVSAWLHGMALRVSLNARKRRAGRREVEQAMDPVSVSDREQTWAGVAPVLDAELERLPARLRGPILLHHLEGKTLKQSAEAAGTSVATIRRRLDEGRELLRKRLDRGGAAVGAALLGLLLSGEARGGEWPPAFATEVLRVSTEAALGGSALATAGTDAARLLAKETMKMMAWKGVGKTVAVIAAGLLLTGALVYGVSGPDTDSTAPATSTADAASPSSTTQTARPPKEAPVPEGEQLSYVKATDEEVASLSAGNNAFGADMYLKLASPENGNLFFSPFSIRTALAMTYAGARGRTASEMKEGLRFTLADERLHAAFKAAAGRLESHKEKGVTLHIANSLWGQAGYELLKPFLDTNVTFHGAGVELVDFVGQTEAARKSINLWVENRTEKKIKDLIPPGGLERTTRLVLANAVHFYGSWKVAFDSRMTIPLPFHLNETQTIQTPMMHNEHTSRYLERPAFQAIELAYRDNKASMVVFLPSPGTDLDALERNLFVGGGRGLSRSLAALAASPRDKVKVFLPKWKMVWGGADLTTTLNQLGIREAFMADRADFSGMRVPRGEDRLSISGVFHKAFVDVNEEGTEAAAATAVALDSRSAGGPPLFSADRPFVFIIRELSTGQVLFMGRLADPRA